MFKNSENILEFIVNFLNQMNRTVKKKKKQQPTKQNPLMLYNAYNPTCAAFCKFCNCRFHNGKKIFRLFKKIALKTLLVRNAFRKEPNPHFI